MRKVEEVSKRPRIPSEIRKQCLESFKDGNGYKKTATLIGLAKSAVREYNRRFKAGDVSWVNRGPAYEKKNIK